MSREEIIKNVMERGWQLYFHYSLGQMVCGIVVGLKTPITLVGSVEDEAQLLEDCFEKALTYELILEQRRRLCGEEVQVPLFSDDKI